MDDMWHVEHVPIEGIEPGVLAHRLIFFHNRGYLGGGTLIYPGCRRIASEPPAHLSYPTLKTTPQPEEHSMSKSPCSIRLDGNVEVPHQMRGGSVDDPSAHSSL